jgi:hypothetical protein
MRYSIISALFLAAALSTPVLAQSSNQQGQKSQTTGQQQAQGSAQSKSGAASHAMTQQKLRSSLEQAGFKEVTIVDAAYLVQAKTSDGDEVLMTINPPMMGSNTSANASGNSGTSGSSGSGQSSSTTPK